MTDATSKPRWYRLTPDRFVIGLLIVECLLWLSERFQWFGFNSHKGWTVLIAVKAVVVFFFLMLLWFADALLFRRQFQFGIRSLLLLVVVIALPCSWLAVEMKEAREQREAVDVVYKVGGSANWDGELEITYEPVWLRHVVGDDFFGTVLQVDIVRSTVSDAELGTICKRLPHIEVLDLFSSGQITDAGLEHLRGLPQLHRLEIGETQVSDAGLKALKGMSRLQSLDLYRTQVSDAGLECFTGMSQLRNLSLVGTKITDAGLHHLAGLSQLQELYLNDTQITGVGLENLTGLSHLHLLFLDHTKVTDIGLEHLKDLGQLRELYLDTTQITDAGLKHLTRLTHLQWLNLDGTNITNTGLRTLKGLSQLLGLGLKDTKTTDEGIRELQQALPKCTIHR